MPEDISRLKSKPKNIRNDTNLNTILAWREGISAHNSRKTLWTDGKDLWSYELLIGYKEKDGSRVVVNYLEETQVSHTTMEHIMSAKGYANLIVAPSQAISRD